MSCHKRIIKRGGSNAKSPDWLKNKKATINSKINDKEFFKFVLMASLYHQEIDSHQERDSNLKPFADRYSLGKYKFLLNQKIRGNLKKRKCCIRQRDSNLKPFADRYSLGKYKFLLNQKIRGNLKKRKCCIRQRQLNFLLFTAYKPHLSANQNSSNNNDFAHKHSSNICFFSLRLL